MTTVYITNRDNLERGFRRLVTWLRDAGEKKIIVIDNASTYPPLLDYYERDKNLMRIQCEENYGPYAFWRMVDYHYMIKRFIITDPDVVPSADCPRDLIAHMHEVMDRDNVKKVGPSLRIDNLPEHYKHAHVVRQWERQFWEAAEGDIGWHAGIDTTFAMYESGSDVQPGGHTIRLAPPYSFEHIPWYEDSANPSPELTYYREHMDPAMTHWSRQL